MKPEQPKEVNEYIEPQVEEAAHILESKGYIIGTLCGQAGKPQDEKQAVVFEHPKRKLPDQLDYFGNETVSKLSALGVRPFSGAMSAAHISLEFSAKGLSPEEISAKWVEIANLLPEVEKKG